MEAILYYNFSNDGLPAGTFFDYITIQGGVLRVEYFVFNNTEYKSLKVKYSLDIDVYMDEYYSTSIQDENERLQHYIENRIKINSIEFIETSFNIIGVSLSESQRPHFTIISEPINQFTYDSLIQKIYYMRAQYPNIALSWFRENVSSDRIRRLLIS